MADPVAAGPRAVPARSVPPPTRRLPPAGHVLAVAAGGAAGGTLRYAFLAAFPAASGTFPWVMLAENLTGAFVLGLMAAALAARARTGPDLRPFVATGVLASFTTFSGLTLDLVLLQAGDAPWLALVFATASLTLGLAAAALGLALGRAGSGGGTGTGTASTRPAPDGQRRQ